MGSSADKRSEAKEKSLRKEIKMGAERESLTDFSRESVDKVVRRVNARGSSGTKGNGKQVVVDTRVTWSDLDGGNFRDSLRNNDDEIDDIDWEDGSNSILDSASTHHLGDDSTRTVTIEFSESLDFAKRKPVRRATSEEKELAEIVHKVHLLCLLARGRLVDSACDDPLIQASLLSLLPSHLLKVSGVPKLSANALSPLVSWFHNNFHVRSCASEKRSFQKALAFALETREGTPDEITALFVALFRALKLTTRFVSILDVASLKPSVDRCESSSQDKSRVHSGIFNNSTLMVNRQREFITSPVESFSYNEKNNMCETSSKLPWKSKNSYPRGEQTCSKDPPDTIELENRTTDTFSCEAQDRVSESCSSPKCQGSKRKGDLEFELQIQMAMFATGTTTPQSSMRSDVRSSTSDSSNISSPFKRIKTVASEGSPSHGISTAVGSQKIGSPLYWAEVYCSGENLTGKWVHVDVVNAIIDGEQKVEAAAAACKTSLRYVVAFAGHGAKDVTRRYCMKWYKIAPQRINSDWWDEVLAPLRGLESGATGGPEVAERNIDIESSERNSSVATRNSLEDVELETRALTEPLPTNQLAYKNHQLYAIERWLTRCQILHPRGPTLGFCSGHPVYPRACVQMLKTKERWLREGLQVKSSELPAKVLRQSGKLKKVKLLEDDDYDGAEPRGTIELYGKWQLEPLQLPHAVNGIVPKNERGQVDVWSEKCVPPGTVHLRLPRVFHVAKKLEIDYAPAMVGFEFKNGRSVPVFEGIVVCAEFKDAILEAYAEEEERRETEEKKRYEAQAISRWYQLLSSAITRQRLQNCYANSSLQMSSNIQDKSYKSDVHDSNQSRKQSRGCQKEDAQNTVSEVPAVVQTEGHEHVFLVEEERFDEEISVKTKRCHCGFSVQVEEL